MQRVCAENHLENQLENTIFMRNDLRNKRKILIRIQKLSLKN